MRRRSSNPLGGRSCVIVRADTLARAYQRALVGRSYDRLLHSIGNLESAMDRASASHVGQLARLADMVKAKRLDVARILAVLDRLPFGILVVESDKRIHASNRQARVGARRKLRPDGSERPAGCVCLQWRDRPPVGPDCV